MGKYTGNTHKSDGFTIIEIGIIVPILIVAVLVLFDALFAMIRATDLEHGKIDLTYDAQSAIANLESDVVLASLFLPSPDATLTTDPYPPTSNGGAWSYLGDSSTSRTLIIQTYSTTNHPLKSDRQPSFIGAPASIDCDADHIYLNEVQQYDIIYFVKNGNLYRRILTDKTTDLCVGQYQKFSCPSQADLDAQSLGARDATCQADDEIIASNVTGFTINYYDTKTSTDDLEVYAVDADPALVTTASDAEITLTVGKKVSGKDLTQSSTLRMSKLNAKIGTGD